MMTKNLKKSTKKTAPKKHKTLKKYKVWSNIHNKYLTFIKSKKKIDIKKDKQEIVNKMSYNSEFINLLDKLKSISSRKGEHFRARAYEKARDAIILFKGNITKPDDLSNVKGIGKTMLSKFQEFIDTGSVSAIEKTKNDPRFLFSDIYGIGPKKADELVKKHNITTIKQLRDKQNEILNDKQKIGLKYYEDILERIPRKEIDLYHKKLTDIFNEVKNKDSTFEIVGSYRRGALDSGDIDIIISEPSDSRDVFNKFLDALISKKILIEVLSRGDVKSLGISKLPRKPARRIDFMFTPKKEYAFAILYFTGSKAFNTGMRSKALKLGYSMNEHGMYKMVDGKKSNKSRKTFPDEKAIFKFLKLKYREPTERKQVYDAIDIIIIKKNKSFKNVSLNINDFDIGKLGSFNETFLSFVLTKANKGYYCNDKPIMSDAEYDMLKEYMEDKFPNNKTISDGHSSCDIAIQKNKIDLPFEMWSMDKEKTVKGVQKRLKKYKGDFVVSAKVDGISILYSNQTFLATRGNGKIGQDISYMIPYLNLPKTDGVFRGELIIKKKTFENKYSKKFANPRNFISGVANSKTINEKIIKDLDVILYEVIEPELSPSEQMTFLSSLKYKNTVKNLILKDKDIDNEVLSKILLDWRENYPWEIDGVIVCHDKIHPRKSGNPDHAFAFKMVLSDQIVEARVVDVIWTPSKDGFVKPRIQIEPVKIGGATITYATAHNAAFVYNEENGFIGPGAIIQMIRSGDVIPKVHKVIAPASKPKGPPKTMKVIWNKTKVDLILENKEDNEIVQLKTISIFFEKIEVVGLGRGNIKRIYNGGFDSIEKIMKMSIDDFLTVEGFKEKMATKVHNSIQKRLKEVELNELMAATNIFGRGMGARRIKKILDVYPNILTETESNAEKTEKISVLTGFQTKTAKTFVPFIKTFIKFLKDSQLEYKLKDNKPIEIKKGHPLNSKQIVFSGVRDKKLEKLIKEVGAEIASSVSKKISYLIVKDVQQNTSKTDKAKKLGVILMTPNSFKNKYF